MIAVAAALLAFAAPASAEVLTGHGTWSPNEGLNGQGDILGATATYDSTTGALILTMTTREAPTDERLAIGAQVGTGSSCAQPAVALSGGYTSPELFTNFLTESGPTEIKPGATNTLSGNTRTLSVTSGVLASRRFGCVELATQDPNPPEPTEIDRVRFTLSWRPGVRACRPDPAAALPGGVRPAPSASTGPAPARLSIAAPKPVTAKVGKWTKVKVRVANPGGTTVGPIAFKAQAPAGVVVKPGSPSLPALLGGQTWTVGLQVKLTEAAKPRSTITLTGTAGALSAGGSVVVKSAG